MIAGVAADWAIPANTLLLVVLALIQLLQRRQQNAIQKQVVAGNVVTEAVHHETKTIHGEVKKAHVSAINAAEAAASAAMAAADAARVARDVGGALRHTAPPPDAQP